MPTTTQSSTAPDASIIPSLVMPKDPESALAQVGAFDVAGLNASVNTAEKNNAVLGALQAAQDSNFNTILDSNQKLQRINSMGGPKSPIVKIMQLFDSGWNSSNLALNIEAANVRTQQAVDKAKTQMEINNTLPTLIESQAKIARELQTGQLNVLDYRMKQDAAARDAQRVKMEAIKTSIDMSQEQRAKAEFTISSMGMEDKQQLATYLGSHPNDPRRGMLGLIQESMFKEGNAEASLRSAQDAASKGDIDAANYHMQNVANNLPSTQLAVGVQQALKTGSAVVSFGQGKDQINIPLHMAMSSMQSNQQTETAARQQLAQEAADEHDIQRKSASLSTSATALATMDPRAKGVLEMQNSMAQRLAADPSYENILQYNAQINNGQETLNQIAADQAKTFNSKEAQAGFLQFAKTGQYSRTGGQAVVTDIAGQPSLSRTTKYAPAFSIINQAVATQLKQAQAMGGAGAAVPVSGTLEANQIFLGQEKNPKLTAIRENVMNDPVVLNQAGEVIKAVQQKDALFSAIQNLSKTKNASPVWRNLIDHPDELMDQTADGKVIVNPNKLIAHLEGATVMTQGKVDYGAALMSALRAYGAKADMVAGNDPRYTPYDHALESAIFGEKPHAAIVSDFVSKLGLVQRKAHSEMQDRIKQDVSGQTQFNANIINGAMGGAKVDPADPRTVPSATGTGLTAAQIKALYGGGN